MRYIQIMYNDNICENRCVCLNSSRVEDNMSLPDLCLELEGARMAGCELLKPNLSNICSCCSITSWPRPASSKQFSSWSFSCSSASRNDADKARASCRLLSLPFCPFWNKKIACCVLGLSRYYFEPLNLESLDASSEIRPACTAHVPIKAIF
jgi:hypothetical protein